MNFQLSFIGCCKSFQYQKPPILFDFQYFLHLLSYTNDRAPTCLGSFQKSAIVPPGPLDFRPRRDLRWVTCDDSVDPVRKTSELEMLCVPGDDNDKRQRRMNLDTRR